MTQPAILGTGATGKVGSAVVAQLRASSIAARAIVHRHEPRSKRLERVGAVRDFLTVPFLPGINPGQFVRDHGFPMPPAHSYDMDSERWKLEHAMQNADSFAGAELTARSIGERE